MSKKKAESHSSGIENVEQVLTKTEQYIEQHKKTLSIILTIIIVIFGGYTIYNKLILPPKEKKAQNDMFIAEQYFEKDSFNVALNGVTIGGEVIYPGFLNIIEDHGITKAANLAHYYAGICYLHLGDYENAIKYLKGFKGRDQLVSAVALGAIGDAYVELENYDSAIEYFLEAAEKSDNDFTTPIYLKKAGIVYEKLEEYNKALKVYEQIKKEYPESSIAKQEIDKDIVAVSLKIE